MFHYRLLVGILVVIYFGCVERSKFRSCKKVETCIFDTVDFINQIGVDLLAEFQLVDSCYIENAFYYDRESILATNLDELRAEDSLVTVQVISALNSEAGLVEYQKYPWSYSISHPAINRRSQFDLIREGKNIGLVVLGYPHQICADTWLICVSYMRGNHGFTVLNYYERNQCKYKRLWRIDSGIIY